MNKIKAFGLAMVAAVALSATAVPATHAGNITSTSFPVVLRGTDLNSEHGKLARWTFGHAPIPRTVECTKSELEATLTGPTTKATFKGNFSDCFSLGLTAVPVTVTMNSCDFTVEPTSPVAAVFYVDCSTAGDAIQIHLYENATKHLQNISMCTYKIGPQGPLGKATLGIANPGTATEDVLLKFALEKISVENTVGSTGLCGIAAGNKGTATFLGEYTITGQDDVTKVHAGITLD